MGAIVTAWDIIGGMALFFIVSNVLTFAVMALIVVINETRLTK
jgi:hypothetical protein